MTVDASGNIDVLLIDDNEDDVHLALRALRRIAPDTTVETVNDGVEALELIRDFQLHGTQLPRVLLVDVAMPRLNGIELVRRLREDDELRGLPIVMFTTSDAARDVDASYEAGCNAYVVKPFSVGDLTDVLQSLITFWRFNVVPRRLGSRA